MVDQPFQRAPSYVASVLLAVALAGCGKQQAPPPPPPPTVTVSYPVQRDVTDWDEYVGHLQSPETAQVEARISGLIVEAPLKEGSLVRKGDVLFVIDDRPYKADLDNKKATVAKDAARVDLAKTQLARSADLLQKHAVSQQDYDTAKATFVQAQAQVLADKAAEETADLNLQWTRVAAPIDGRVGKMAVTEGNLVSGGAGGGQGSLLTTIVSVDPIYCYVPVPESAFLRYQSIAGRNGSTDVRTAKIPCGIGLVNEPAFPHAGYIDFMDNSVDIRTGTIQIRGVIPNPSGELTPGLSAKMRITGTGSYKALLVPNEAVGTEQNEHYLLVLGQDNIVATREVKLGTLFGALRSITAGLKAGDAVIVDGLQHARSGMKVTPHEAPISGAALESLPPPSQAFQEKTVQR